MPDNPPKRLGRPTTEPKAGAKATLNVRAAPSLKQQLLDAAQQADRSLSAEMEFRLEFSFRDEELLSATLQRIAGGDLNGVLAETLARIIGRHAEEARIAGRPSWLDDRDEHEILVRALAEAVRSLHPPGPITLSEELLAERVARCMRPWFNSDLCLRVAAHQGGPQSHAAQFLKGYPPAASGGDQFPPDSPKKLRPGRRLTVRVFDDGRPLQNIEAEGERTPAPDTPPE
jgi:hypothetical protein